MLFHTCDETNTNENIIVYTVGPDAIVQCLDFREELNMVGYVKIGEQIRCWGDQKANNEAVDSSSVFGD